MSAIPRAVVSLMFSGKIAGLDHFKKMSDGSQLLHGHQLAVVFSADVLKGKAGEPFAFMIELYDTAVAIRYYHERCQRLKHCCGEAMFCLKRFFRSPALHKLSNLGANGGEDLQYVGHG